MKSKLKVLVWVICFQSIGFLMSILTRTGKLGWYDSIIKSSLTPPGFVFGITWTILYIILAIFSWWLWQKKSFVRTKVIFSAQMLLNWLWTPVFFSFHLISVALIMIILMMILTTQVLLSLGKQQSLISLLLLPYLIWLCFACYLNSYIWLYN